MAFPVGLTYNYDSTGWLEELHASAAFSFITMYNCCIFWKAEKSGPFLKVQATYFASKMFQNKTEICLFSPYPRVT
jgi:nitrogen fixation protein FixH